MYKLKDSPIPKRQATAPSRRLLPLVLAIVWAAMVCMPSGIMRSVWCLELCLSMVFLFGRLPPLEDLTKVESYFFKYQ